MATSTPRAGSITSTPVGPRAAAGRRRAAGALTPAAAAVLLVVWGLFPVALLLAHAASDHARFTGADGLIGADGVLGADQLQYLAWARDAAGHGAAADLFRLTPSRHVYLEPVFGLIGALSRLGVSLIVGELAFTVLAGAVLAGAAVSWARRLLPGRPGRVGAAAALALFCSSPASAFIDWAQSGSAPGRFAAYLAGDELSSATKLWGYLPAAFGIALLPVALLALERALAPGPRARRRLGAAALAALLASWLHPWQGATLALMLGALAAWRRRPAELPRFGIVLGAALLPLAYYAVLSHADSAWRMATGYEDVARLPGWVLFSTVGPLVAIALAGVRRPGDALAEQALVAWIPAALVTYFTIDAFPTHALQGIALPFGVLAVRAGERVGRRLPAGRRMRGLAGAMALAALTIPGAAYGARKFARVARSGLVQYELPRDDVRALRWLRTRAPGGGVLAPTPFAAVIPAESGRHVWVGHGDWSPAYGPRAAAADRFFDDRLGARAASAFVGPTGARILLADCGHPRAGQAFAALGRRVAEVVRFGCARAAILRDARGR